MKLRASDQRSVDLARMLGPRFQRERLKAMVHYVCWTCEDPRTLSTQRLNSILWYADRNLYLARGRPATGATYVRCQSGPRARSLEAALRELEQERLVVRRGRAGGDDLLFALTRSDAARFEAAEISEVETGIRNLCFDARTTIAHQAAHDAIWRAAEIGETLPYFTACAGQAGDIQSADIRWAMIEISRRSSGGEPVLSGGQHPRGAEAVEALLWHLRHDPSLGLSLPTTDASWFIYKQAGLTEEFPEITVVYRFELNELLPAAIRIGPCVDDLDDDA